MVCALRLLVACRDPSAFEAVRAVAEPLGCAVDPGAVHRLREAFQGTGYDAICVDAQPPGCDDVQVALGVASSLAPAARPRVIGIAARAPAARVCRNAAADIITPVLLAQTLVAADRAADGSLIDTQLLMSLRDLQEPGSADVVGELSQMFREDGQRRLDRLRVAAAGGDREEVLRAAHSLKGSAGFIGAWRLARVCAVVEAGAPRAPLPLLDAMLARAARVFEASLEALDQL